MKKLQRPQLCWTPLNDEESLPAGCHDVIGGNLLVHIDFILSIYRWIGRIMIKDVIKMGWNYFFPVSGGLLKEPLRRWGVAEVNSTFRDHDEQLEAMMNWIQNISRPHFLIYFPFFISLILLPLKKDLNILLPNSLNVILRQVNQLSFNVLPTIPHFWGTCDWLIEKVIYFL